MNSFALALIHPAQFPIFYAFLYVHFLIHGWIKSLWPIDSVIYLFLKSYPDHEWIVIENEFALPLQIA